MQYAAIREASFVSRPNRFIARILVDGREESAHVKNTGRCRELLVPGARLYVQHHDSPARKTAWSVIGVQKGERLINMDSQAPNQVWEEALNGGLVLPGREEPVASCRREVTPAALLEDCPVRSRFDFALAWRDGAAGFLEVKGVTLEQEGVARFPDAPTQRGRRHLEELARLAQAGYYAGVAFVIQMAGVDRFEPNDATDPAFGEALRRAERAGVQVLAYDCTVTPDSLAVRRPVRVALDRPGDPGL